MPTGSTTRQPQLVPPRFGTPRDPSRKTLGPQLAKVAEAFGLQLHPWQRHVADVALEVDDEDRLIYREVVITVPRQSGKTFLILVKIVWRLIVMAQTLGTRQLAVYTAQSRTKAREKLELEFANVLRESGARRFREIDHPRRRPQRRTEWKINLNNGAERIQFGRGNYLMIDAPTKTAGHGSTLDDGTIDEAFAHQDDAVELAMEPTMQTRDSPQLWVVSTAGDDRSFFLWRKVLAGRKACETGRHAPVAYFEWSLPDDAAWDDEKLWPKFHPNYHNPNVRRAMRAACEKAKRNPEDPEAGVNAFRRSYCNQWPKTPRLSTDINELPIPLATWDDLFDRTSVPADPVVFGIASMPDMSSSTITVASYRANGQRVHVEVVQSQKGVRWIGPRVKELVENWGPAAVVVRAGDQAASQIPELKAHRDVEVVKLGEQSFAAACGAFRQRATSKGIVHRGDPQFRTALEGLRTRQVGRELEAWDPLDSTSDITSIVAATCALAHLPQAAAEDDDLSDFYVY